MQLEEPIEMLEPEPEPETDPIRLPHDQSGIDMEDDEVAAAVARTLLVPAHHVKAVEDNSDRIHEKHGAAGVQAYAKLSGNGWTFYVKKLVNVIGRPPEQPCDTIEPPQDLEHGALPAAAESDRGVHVNLGPSKMVSRNHAEILFDSNTEKWNIQVQGRNGIRINGATLRRGEVKPLSSGEVIEIGGVEMMFVMPKMKKMSTDCHQAPPVRLQFEATRVRLGACLLPQLPLTTDAQGHRSVPGQRSIILQGNRPTWVER